jgi:hypothetical protein
MRIIKKFVENISEEIEDAKKYAEQYIEHKVKNNMQAAHKYHEMASDELKHAMYIHEFATKEIESLSKVYTPPVEMLEKWEHEHKKYVEDVALIKQILAM